MSAPITSIFSRRGCSTAVTSTFVRRIALYNKPRILSYNIFNNNTYSITAQNPPNSVSFYHQSHHHLTKMQSYPGSCFCHKITYNLNLSSPDDARTSLCHCRSCKVSQIDPGVLICNLYLNLAHKVFDRLTNTSPDYRKLSEQTTV